MSEGWIGYDPQRVGPLRTRAGHAAAGLQAVVSDDPAAAAAQRAVTAARATLEEHWLPLLDRILDSDAMASWSAVGAMSPVAARRSEPAGGPWSDAELVDELDAAVDAVLTHGATAREWDRLAVVLAAMATRASQPAFVRWLREEHGPEVLDRLLLALDRHDRRSGVEPPPDVVMMAAATLVSRAARHDLVLRGRVSELDDELAVIGRLAERAEIVTTGAAQEVSYAEVMSAIDAAGLGTDVVEAAMEQFDGADVQALAVVIDGEEVYLFTDGARTGIVVTGDRPHFADVGRAPDDLPRLAGDLGRVAGGVGLVLDLASISAAFGDGWAADGRPPPFRVFEGAKAALPAVAGVVADEVVFAGGTAACALIPGVGLASPLCGVAAVFGTKVAADALDNEGAPASFCENGVFDAEQADSMGFDHTTEEVAGCD